MNIADRFKKILNRIMQRILGIITSSLKHSKLQLII